MTAKPHLSQNSRAFHVLQTTFEGGTFSQPEQVLDVSEEEFEQFCSEPRPEEIAVWSVGFRAGPDILTFSKGFQRPTKTTRLRDANV